ncbi:MAG: DUF3795 domain-containing protein [Anaerolineae bacterium]|nr:DUF3795 domain-containing protein [Anaerolineae bacterium]
MEIQAERIAPCGLYCGMCRLLHATQDDDQTLLERLARIYARRPPTRRLPEMAPLTADDLLCDGYQSTRRSVLCRECSIRECAQQKGLGGCHLCPDFPCPLIDEFPVPVGKRVILRAIPYWREHGTEQWIMAEEKRYECSACGGRLYRGAQRCPHCKSPVDVD